MAGLISNEARDQVVTAFRQALCQKYGVIPFHHQASWWAASDGLVLLDEEVGLDERGVEVQYVDKSIHRIGVVDRPYGRARVLADLGSFKIGKSFGSALWMAAFAAIPGARVQLVGLEYDICAPEFEYLCEFLLSDRGMGIKADSIQNRPRDGRMWLDLPNGTRFEAKSWDRKDTLKGKEIDCYLYCEAYMLPGLECYTDYSQNLRARDGYAVFATTPDRPWLQEFYEKASSGDQRFRAWHCTSGVGADANPYTFDAEAKERDKELMTREKFAIHYEGQLGDFVGRVYGYQRGQRQFTVGSHPELFRTGRGDRLDLCVPPGWEVVGGADTGTMFSSVLVAFSPAGDAFVIDEFPNYGYVSGKIELSNETFPEWCGRVWSRHAGITGKPILSLYADKNSQFKREAANQRDFHLSLESNPTPLEVRTEIAREYFQHEKIHLAPWLRVLPFEIENAQWPVEATAGGKFARMKDRDHTLDCLEHVLSKRPRGKWPTGKPAVGSWLKEWLGKEPKSKRSVRDPHMGGQ
jgi:hypothetical protein